MHLAYPVVEAVNRPAVANGSTNMQSIEMLKYNNLLDSSSVYSFGSEGRRLLQNPMAQFLPDSMANQKMAFALGGSSCKKSYTKK